MFEMFIVYNFSVMASVQAWSHFCSLKPQLEILEVFPYAPSDRPPLSLHAASSSAREVQPLLLSVP